MPQCRVTRVYTHAHTPQGTKTYTNGEYEAGEWKDGEFVGQVGDALPYMVDIFPHTHARCPCR